MTFIQTSPVWYGGGIGNNRNASDSVGHITYTGFIFPKYQSYEYNKNPKQTN